MTCACGHSSTAHTASGQCFVFWEARDCPCTGYRPAPPAPIDLPAAIRAERLRRDTGRGIQGELASAPTSLLVWLEEWARQQEKP